MHINKCQGRGDCDSDDCLYCHLRESHHTRMQAPDDDDSDSHQCDGSLTHVLLECPLTLIHSDLSTSNDTSDLDLICHNYGH